MLTSIADIYITSIDQVESSVKRFAEERIVSAEIKKLGIAVSGGADSVALFHLLLPICAELDISPLVLHLNHGLREASAEEAEFVKGLAASHNIEFASKTLDLKNRPQNNQSLEMAARQERICFYGQTAKAYALDAIATGHHADDLCETLLLRLFRGAGMAGLCGMRPLSRLKSESPHNLEITTVRPLLHVSSKTLRAWLREQNFKWREDLSNLDTCIPRNNLRHNIIPFLRDNLDRKISARLALSAETLRADEALLNQIAAEKLNELRYNESLLASMLLRQPLSIQRRALRLWLFEQKLSECSGFSVISELINLCENGGKTQILKDIIVQREDELLSVIRGKPFRELPNVELVPGSSIMWGDFKITTHLSTGINAVSAGVAVFPATCSLSAKKLNNRSIIVRQRKAGDRIKPTGFKGSKKIKDVLIDAQIPQDQRSSIPIVTCDEDVLWIPGYRISRNYAVDSERAKSINITVTRVNVT